MWSPHHPLLMHTSMGSIRRDATICWGGGVIESLADIFFKASEEVKGFGERRKSEAERKCKRKRKLGGVCISEEEGNRESKRIRRREKGIGNAERESEPSVGPVNVIM